MRTLVNRFCKPVDIKLVFSTLKIKNLFNVKDPLPDRLRTRVVYKFSCASCNACYIGETSRHFATRVREHLSSDRSSHVFKHLQSSESCRISCSADCFTVLDSATTKFQVKLKKSSYVYKMGKARPESTGQTHQFDAFLVGNSTFGRLRSGARVLYVTVETFKLYAS